MLKIIRVIPNIPLYFICLYYYNLLVTPKTVVYLQLGAYMFTLVPTNSHLH